MKLLFLYGKIFKVEETLTDADVYRWDNYYSKWEYYGIWDREQLEIYLEMAIEVYDAKLYTP